MKMLLKNGNVYRDGKFSQEDVLIQDCVVKAIGKELADASDAEVISVEGKYVVPGFVDVHVHFREPGFSAKETIGSGSAAAARGGYTTVCTMPNLNPAPDCMSNLEQQLRLIRESAIVKIIPYGTITKGQKGAGELIDFEELRDAVIGFSDDGRGVQSDALMEEAMRRAKNTRRPIVAHCEVDELIRGGYIHDGEYARLHGHKGICSESEWQQVARDIELVRKTGCQYHVCHVSTKESVELVRRAKAEGLKVSCETAPHYLVLTDMDLQEDGRFKMNPPIRSAADREALRQGIADGTIEVIATDHAPHTVEEKSKGLAGSMMGVVGLETAFPVLYKYVVKEGVVSLEKLVELMSVNPRRLFGMEAGLAVGAMADITVLDLEPEYKVDPEEFATKGRATPFAGVDVQGRNVMTIVDGNAVYTAPEFK